MAMKSIGRRGEVGWGLWRWWVLANVVGGLVGWVLLWNSPDSIRYFLGLVQSDLNPFTFLPSIVATQWLVLRWWFSRGAWLVLATVLGLILHSVIIELLLFSLLNAIVTVVIGIVIIVIGVVLFRQRQRVEEIVSRLVHRQRWAWALIWAVVTAVGFTVQWIVQSSSWSAIWYLEGGESPSFLGMTAGVTFGYLLFGIITATALILFLQRPPLEE